MGNAYELRLARRTDLGRILGLITDASKWLASKGTDQWQEPWPDRRARDERIRAAVHAGKTWILVDGETAVGTITAEWQGDPAPGLPALWSAGERAQPAVYAHRMAVRRVPGYQGRGIGGQMLDVVGRIGRAAYDAEYLRLDAWTTNSDLHSYYKDLGFEPVHTYREDEIGCPSGALFQKPAVLFGETVPTFAVNATDVGIWSERANAARAVPAANEQNRTLTTAIRGR